MSTSTFVGNSDGLVTGLCSAPPPPPPPPPVPGQVPAMRINTVEAPTTKRPQIPINDAYEPPAAIQNAMLTKDKKPFTYTPGMGGKLDLSQIRSPRMARRVAKNANDEGIEGPPKSALEPKPTPPPNTGASLFVQPQVAIPVFPTNVPVQPSVNRTPPTPPANRTQPTTPEKQQESPKLVTKAEAKVTPTITIQPNTPESAPSTPTQVTLAKAPTPWLQNKNKPQEELPEWAKRSNVNRQQSSSSSSPDSPTSPPIYTSSIQQQTQQQQQQPPQWQQAQQRPQSQPPQQTQQRPQQIQQPQLYQYQQQQQPQQFIQQQKRPFSGPSVTQQINAPAQPQERVIPIRIEDRPSVFDVKPEPGHHQFKQPSPHHQQRWGQQPQNQIQVQNQAQNQIQNQVPQQSSGGAYIIPIMIEGSDKKPATGAATSNSPYSQPIVRNNVPNVENPNVKVVTQRIIPVQAQQSDSGPVQSRSFRVLQKITDTDSSNDVDTEQMRKLQLSEDDRILMNKFKEQIDNESSLHHEEDPRYRGGAIPSRAFRFLQTMTESGDAPAPVNTTQRPPSAINKKQNRNSKTFEETQANLPPSEQQVPEPKKYMGSAIPSRSFRILQAMTAPESVATQENRQADYHCQTENNVPGNQQGVFLSPCPPPFWTPDSGWWGYYPLPYPGVSNDVSYPYHPDNTAYVYFPIYNHRQSYPPYPQYDPTTNDKMNAYASVYPPYVVPAPPQSNNNNCSHNCEQVGRTGENPILAKIHPTTNVTDIPDIPQHNIQEHNRGLESRITGENDDSKDLPQWEKGNSVSRTASNSSKDSDCTTAMNITDEEEIPDEIVISEINEEDEAPDRPETKSCPNGSLNVNVPNYTYIDTSDSSDSTDSTDSESDSQSDNESIIESFKSDSSTSSDSDSDSYLAYSTRPNAHGGSENDDEKNSSGNGSSKESCNEEENSVSSDKNNSDPEAEDVEEQEREFEKTEIGTFPHQLSVIYEDVEQPESESPRPREARSVKGWNGTPFEATDDPPDDSDAPTVSVSLPLRFKFSVSENNEDVTTVIVGDSTIKPERGYNREESRRLKTAEVSADFVVKKEGVNAKRKPKETLSNERTKEETAENKAKENEDPVVPHVNFTLRKIPTRFSKINCGETVETEFTIRRKTSVKREEDRASNVHEERANVKNNDDSASRENKGSNSVYVAKDTGSETRDFNRNILKPEVIVSECNWTDESSQRNERPSDKLQNADTKIERADDTRENSDDSKRSKNEEDAEEKTGRESKHLLSVQNSREETDDEDSGVTSDMSRMISEADTDSECTSSKNMRKYQRTQTHSRLFRLLNDDSILPECAEKSNESSATKEYLSLPLNSNNFNYDENYCSNYSSGVTSPEYSPISEQQSWKRLHDANGSAIPDQNGDVFRQGHPLTRQDRISCKEDPYYQAWKTSRSPAQSLDHDVVPSLAFKVLESRRPLWSYKVNVLCPRIKSTKSVPQTLRTNKQADSTVSSSSNPLSFQVNLKSDHC